MSCDVDPDDPLRFILPLTPSQNVLQRWHWAVLKKHRREMATALHTQCLMQRKMLPMVPGKASVRVLRYTARKLDHGNFVGGCKTLLDAMRDCNLLVDDSPSWLEDSYEQIKATKAAARTEVWLSYVR